MGGLVGNRGRVGADVGGLGRTGAGGFSGGAVAGGDTGAGRLAGGGRGAARLAGGWERGVETWLTGGWGGARLVSLELAGGIPPVYSGAGGL